MWDFSFGRAVAMVLQTAPYLGLRLLVFFGIAIAYLTATGIGAVMGYGFGFMAGSPDAPMAGAFWGGVLGFGLTAAILYFLREYILYLVKAAHIAVLVQLYDGKPLPSGNGQIAYGSAFVREHFAQSSILFGVDQIVKGVLRIITGTLNVLTAWLPVPALQTLLNIVNAIIRLSITYVDEVIMAYLIRTQTRNPWETAADGLVLYAQNYRSFIKNAVWLSLFMWGLTFLIFLFMVGPMVAVMAVFPGGLSVFGVVIAFIFAWAFKAALMEPVAVACLMQVYFKVTEGQAPDPEWRGKLHAASGKFRALLEKAGKWVPKAPANGSGAAKPATGSQGATA